MKAAVLAKPSTFDVCSVSLPDQVACWTPVKVSACGICGSDLAIYDRDPPIPRYWPGHEIAGFVEGQLVVVNPLLSCGECAFCRSGRENICVNAQMISHHLPGGFAELVYAPQSHVVPIRTTPERAALVEPLASCLHALERAKGIDGARVVIVGGGTIGLLLVQLAHRAGARSVALLARYPFQKDLALRLGAVEPDFAPDVVYIAAAGDGSALQYAVDCANHQAQVISIGNIYRSRQLNLKWLVERELTVSGSQRYTGGDFARAVSMIENEHVELDLLITHLVSLQDISLGYSLAAGKASSAAIKVLVRPGA